MRTVPVSALLLASLLISCKGGDETDTGGDTDVQDTDTGDCTASDWFTDADADGFGDDATLVSACEAPNGAVTQGGDCDDADGDVHPGATEVCDGADDDCDGTADDGVDLPTFWADADADGFGDPAASVQACEAPEGHVGNDDDCDDTNALFNPNADESDCTDPADYNCDGSTGYADADSDGFAACLDCDDADPDVNPGRNEVCNGLDDDCDDSVDEEALDTPTWYADADLDGYGDPDVAATVCDAPSGYVSASGDCDDADAAYNPAAVESCDDPTDWNCDGSVAYADADADGFAACNDCDDAEAAVNPDATEVCNGLDDDCTGTADDGASDAPTWYFDGDSDGYGDALVSVTACEAPANHVSASDDCDDADAAFFPGAAETCDDPNDYNCDGSVAYADADSDGFAACEDCDDALATVNSAATEACNDIDDDCDGIVDEPDAIDASTWYADTDEDGYGDPANSIVACEQPAGFVADATDCDDADAALNPDTVWFADADEDGWGDAEATMVACEQPSGYIARSGDCDDAVGSVNPDGSEVCNDTDDDCDGTADDSASDAPTWYADADSDGFGDASETLAACDAPAGFVSSSTDCDDLVGTTFPGADETCNLEDDDCNGVADEDYATDALTWWYDGDSDGFGGATSAMACEMPADHVATSGDCNDASSGVNPGAAEICDASNVDEDCDGSADDLDSAATGKITYYTDGDADSYGAGAGSALCDAPSGAVTVTGDCDDTSSAVNPAATEVCDASNVDEDCDGSADDLDTAATGKITYYTDADADLYGAGAGSTVCDAPSGAVTVTGDCNDASSAVNPGATEVCDASDTDEDCDGSADDLDSAATGKTTFYVDGDGDSYGGTTSETVCDAGAEHVSSSTDCNDALSSAYPGAAETAGDSIDQDCDGSDLDQIDYAHTQWPCSISVTSGASTSVYGWVYMSGVTDSTGQGAGITAQVGYGADGSTPSDAWTWTTATYLGDKDGLSSGDLANDEYTATLTVSAYGAYDYGWRFSYDGGRSWVYGDLGGSGCGGSGSADGWNSAASLSVAGIDADADGYYSEASGGDDCDDSSSAVKPGATEITDDGLDNDCVDGDTVTMAGVAAGDLVITEIMYNPVTIGDEFGEYFEIYNASADTILLDGLYVTDSSGSSTSFSISGSSYKVVPGDYFVIGRTTDTSLNDGAAVDYGWGTSTSSTYALANSADSVYLKTSSSSGSTTIDSLVYNTTSASGWPSSVAGMSIELDADAWDATSNDTASNWCKATSLYGTYNKGTPGADNTGC